MPSDTPFSADARSLGSTRTLIGVIFWPTAVLLALPSTVAGLWSGIGAMEPALSSDLSAAVASIGVGVGMLAGVSIGVWLLFGYGKAYFSAQTPIGWRRFWIASATYNGLAAGGWCVALIALARMAEEIEPVLVLVGLLTVWPLVVCGLSFLIARREPMVATGAVD